MRRALLLGATLLASCGDTPQTGGFETTDLQARAVRPDGSPVASARVWLVRSAGTDAPAAVLDSGLTDTSGLVRFVAPTGGSAGLGLDAATGDSLGLSPLALTRSDTARVVVSPAHAVSTPAGSDGVPLLFVPGSHFASNLQDGATGARIRLPSGTWTLATRVAGISSLATVAISRDTVLPAPTPRMDTTAQAAASVHAARSQLQTLDVLELDVSNESGTQLDSLTIRLYMDGTSAEMADLAVRPDIAQVYSAAGFNSPLTIDAARWRTTVPKAVGPCPAAAMCSWAVDLPVEAATLENGGRLHLSFLFDKHTGSGDSLQYANARPTHDPLAGTDWSVRARAWADSATRVPGLPDYAGVPTSTGSIPATAPYIVLLRKNRLVSGKPPSLLL